VIIIKDYYILLFINKLKNKFNKVKIFIKLNLYKVYNFIYIKKIKNKKKYFIINIIILNIK